jgi:2'-5' RNA ligase
VNTASLDVRPDIRFGVYLRPSLAMARAQVEIHDLIARQYGSMCAGRFMPHATIKGFFRSEASVEQMTAVIDVVMTRHKPFEVTNSGPVLFGGGGTIVLDIHHRSDGQTNLAIAELHRDVFTSLADLVHEHCDFTPVEPALNQFHAHLTLMMGDVPRTLKDEIYEFVCDAEPVGPPTFTADRVHLVALRSREWNGQWWETLQWTILHSWSLGKGGTPVERPTWNVPG